MTLLVLAAISGQELAFPASAVAELVHLPRLARLPTQPPVLAGVLLLRGRVVPVARLDRLLGLPDARFGPWAVVIVLSRPPPLPWAVAVERAVDVTEAERLEPAPAGLSYNDCVGWSWPSPGGAVPVLEPARLLDRGQCRALEAFHDEAERRRREWCGDGV
ncbi:MAG: CheW domain-containing protein [Pseudomonadota bacterium]